MLALVLPGGRSVGQTSPLFLLVMRRETRAGLILDADMMRGSGSGLFWTSRQFWRFFEERRGRLNGFRFRDPFDHCSCALGSVISAEDQLVGIGDGVKTTFQLKKTYGGLYAPYERSVTKPVEGTVLVAINGVVTSNMSMDVTSGEITFDTAPDEDAAITAGFRFDVPVRFDTDQLEFSLSGFEAGDIPSIPLLEIRL